VTEWWSFLCPVCGFQHLPRRFKPEMKPILYPARIMTGGGRARGFKVVRQLPWKDLAELRTDTSLWSSVQSLYTRLAYGFDMFFLHLGYLSPGMVKLLQKAQSSYADIYLTNTVADIGQAYSPVDLSENTSGWSDYSEVYRSLFKNDTQEVGLVE
jgi:hypothetical protein